MFELQEISEARLDVQGFSRIGTRSSGDKESHLLGQFDVDGLRLADQNGNARYTRAFTSKLYLEMRNPIGENSNH